MERRLKMNEMKIVENVDELFPLIRLRKNEIIFSYNIKNERQPAFDVEEIITNCSASATFFRRITIFVVSYS
jgi:hypothetical protein